MGLFSKKKKDAGSNPYADGQVPYANPLTPYQQARNNMAQGAPTGLAGPAPPASSSNSGFGDDKYGNQSGYGSERYGSSSRSTAPSAGGYGGFDDGASGKGELFGGAGARYQPPQPNQQQNGPPSSGGQGAPVNRNPALFGAAPDRYNPYAAAQQQAAAAGGADDEYGGYGAPRELTGELTPSGRNTKRI